ncbi:Retrovirus-related Pol polyprotein from type-2 retrotransposable element R2DM, partial [Araneus ventricosus]
MSDTANKSSAEFATECLCADSATPTTPACSPICRRTRSQIARRTAIIQDPPSSLIEICSNKNVMGPPPTPMDTTLESEHGTDCKNDEDVDVIPDHTSGICHASLINELDIAPNLGHHYTSPASIASTSPSSDSMPNFSIGDCPIIVNDSLIISLMVNEILDITCNDLLAEVPENQAPLGCDHSSQATPIHDGAPSVLLVPDAQQILSTDENSRPKMNTTTLANQIAEDILSMVFQEYLSLNHETVHALNESVSPPEIFVNIDTTNLHIIENVENCENRAFKNIFPNEISAFNDLTTENPSTNLNGKSQIEDDVESTIDDSHILGNQSDQSFVIVIESDSEIDDCPPADCISGTGEGSYPTFSLELEIPGNQIKPEALFQTISPPTDDQDFPPTDEIELFQIITENRSTITFESLLPQKFPCLPTFDTPALFSCEYCERTFQNETDAQAHIYDLHLNPCIPSYQEDQAVTLLRNYPDPGCSSCKLGFLTLNMLNKHCMKIHNSKNDQFSCGFCDTDFLDISQFYTHRCCEEKDLPPRKPFHCHNCDESFESLWQRDSHICSGDFDDISEGDLSENEPFPSHPILFPIMTNSFPQRSFIYDNPECDGTLPDDALMIPFMGTHSSSSMMGIFHCNQCPQSFSFEESLAKHIVKQHIFSDILPYNRKKLTKKQPFSSCKNCSTTFASGSSLLAHICTQDVSPSSPLYNVPALQLHEDSVPILNDTPINPIESPPETSVQLNADSIYIGNETSAGTSNLPICTPQPIDGIGSSSNKKKWPCDFKGCKIVKGSKKGLSIHKFKEHKIPFPKRDIPSNTQPSQNVGNAQSQNQGGISTDDPTNISSQNCPTHTSRSGDTVNFLFPLQCPTLCTEQGCIFDSNGKTWSSNKCSLLRHLRSAHRLSNLTSIHWCATCAQKIGKPKKHPCLAQGVMVKLPFDSEFKCQECDENFTSDLGLRNHTSAHKKSTAIANSVQRVIPRMGTRKWKNKKPNPVNTSSEPPDEAITDPTCVLAPPPAQSNSTPPPPPDDEQPPGPLSIYIDHLQDLLNQDPTEEFFDMFSETMEMALTDIKNLSFQSASNFTEQSIGESSAVNPANEVIPNRQKPQKKEINIIDPQSCQSLYNRNRKRCVREICSGPPTRCMIPVETVEDFFRSAWDSVPPPIPDLPIATEERTPLLEHTISISEVSKKLARAENSAPGPDRLTYHHWRSLPQGHKFLATSFNVCIHFQKVPDEWRKTTTILIPKSLNNLDSPANWRPIALSNTIYKIFTKVLAGRLQDWSTKFDVLSHCQKGFTPFDGVLEHNFILQTRLESARAHKKDLCVAWLDVTNAFGALPHPLIYKALHAAGTGDQFVKIIKDIYTDCSTSILTNDSITGPIPIKSGVKQGCPISGLLFNMSIDHILRRVQGDFTDHRILAFADDLCLIGDSREDLQDMLDVVFEEMSKIGLLLNPSKSFSLHLSASTPVNVPGSLFSLGPDTIKPILEYEFTKFLGKPVGFNPVSDYSSFNSFADCAKKILDSQLSPWQKMDAMKSFIFPATQFSMRTGQFKKEDWTLLDESIRHAVKEILFLPERAANEYIYGHTKAGCVGLPISAEESDLNRVDSAFKLLTSNDEIVAQLALTNLRNSVAKRVRIPTPTDDDMSDFMSGSLDIDEDDKPHSNPYSNIWTTARVASRRQKIQWLFSEGHPQLKFQDLIIKSSSRRKILFTIRNRLRQDRSQVLQNKPDQGKAMECVAQSPISSHFMANGLYTRFSEYRFIHRARLNLLPL